MLKKFNDYLNKIFPNIHKLKLLAEAIDEVKVTDDKSVYIKYKKHVIIESKGSYFTYTKDGYNLSMAKIVHINPTTKDAMDLLNDDIDGTVEHMNNKTLEAQELYLKEMKQIDNK